MFARSSIFGPLTLALCGLASAEGVYSSTSSAPAPTHTVSVAIEAHRFTPEILNANVGEIIEFRFYPLNHSVARADFKQPCIPYELTGPGRVGFWSGFHPLNVIPSDPPYFRIKVNDTNPIFYYCSAPGACDQDGMVGVINPNSTQTLDMQREAAGKATFALSPGENFPEEVTASRSPSTLAALATATQPATSSSAAATASHDSHPIISAGVIAGIVIGAMAVCLLAGTLIYLCGRQRTISEIVQTHQRKAQAQLGMGVGMGVGNGNNSMANPAAYSSKGRHNVRGLEANRFPGEQGAGYYDRSVTATESYRSRSPAIDEHGEFVLPMNLQNVTCHQSPEMRRPAPVSPLAQGGVGGQQSPTSFTSPRSEQEGYPQMDMSADVPAGLRIQRGASRYGPHELAGDEDLEMQEVPPYSQHWRIHEKS